MKEVKPDAAEREVVVQENNDPKFTSMMAVHSAMHGQPVEFKDTINNMLVDRANIAVEKKREEIAKAIFGHPNQEPQDDNQASESESGAEDAGESGSVVDSEDDDTPAEE